MESSKKNGGVSLTVAATLPELTRGAQAPEVVAYAFSSGGQLLDQQPVDAKGVATLTLPKGTTAQSVRVLVGPRVEVGEQHVADLLRQGAVEKMVRVEPGDLKPSAKLVVSPEIWRCWLRGLCTVKGTLLKRTESGGVNIDLPIGNAEVEIYEVDPLTIIVPRLPDDIIEKIRDMVLIPFPEPPDPIGPISVLPEVLENLRKSAISTASTQRLTAAAPQKLTAASAARVLNPRAAMKTITAQPMNDELRSLARSANTAQFRDGLLKHQTLLRPILCKYFPTLVTKHLIAKATTDTCGHFHALFFRGCNNLADQPDLYFIAKQRLFGFFDVTIYEPKPVACYTHWDYVCGTEVTLYSKHPLAMTNPPCAPVVAPNNWVLFTAVGNLPLSRIRGTGSTLQGSTTPITLGLTDGNAPFGGLLRFRIEFDNSLRDNLNVKYYQVSYRKGTSGAFTPLVGECHRHYSHKIGSDLVLEVYPLGPKVINGVPNLFEIPPALPPLGQWSFPDLTEDLTSAKFATNDLAPLAAPGAAWPEAGKYQVKLDLFDANGAAVNIAAKGIAYRVPTSTDLSGTIQTADAATLGLVNGNSMVITLHVDNSVCSANIAAPTINGTAADPCCGVLQYGPGDSVTMNWTAAHANQFAAYSFGVVRGVNGVFAQSGQVAAGPFSTTQTVATLMSANAAAGCDPSGCKVAGFSENLYVAATATDGWSRLSGYDASAVRAFVLAKND